MLILDWDAYLENLYKIQMVGYVSKDPVCMDAYEFANCESARIHFQQGEEARRCILRRCILRITNNVKHQQTLSNIASMSGQEAVDIKCV